MGLHRHLHARGGEAVADDLRDGQVVGAVGAQEGDREAPALQGGPGRLRVVVVLHHVLVVIQAALGDVPGAAHRARATEHAVHHAPPVDGGVYRLPQGQIQKVGAGLVVDEHLVAHIVGLLHHADGRVAEVGVHQVGGQLGDVNLPVFKGQQGVAHRHKLDLLRPLLPVAPAVEGGELIAAGGPVVGGAGVGPAARQIAVAGVGVGVVHALPDVLGEDHEGAQAGQGVGGGLLHGDGDGLLVLHGVVIHNPPLAGTQGVGHRGVLLIVVQGEGHVGGGQGLPVLELGVLKESEGVVAAVHGPALRQPGHVPLLVLLQQAAVYQAHLGRARATGLVEEGVGRAVVGAPLQTEGVHLICGRGGGALRPRRGLTSNGLLRAAAARQQAQAQRPGQGQADHSCSKRFHFHISFSSPNAKKFTMRV